MIIDLYSAASWKYYKKIYANSSGRLRWTVIQLVFFNSYAKCEKFYIFIGPNYLYSVIKVN